MWTSARGKEAQMMCCMGKIHPVAGSESWLNEGSWQTPLRKHREERTLHAGTSPRRGLLFQLCWTSHQAACFAPLEDASNEWTEVTSGDSKCWNVTFTSKYKPGIRLHPVPLTLPMPPPPEEAVSSPASMRKSRNPGLLWLFTLWRP